jgi:transposase InsO family protein
VFFQIYSLGSESSTQEPKQERYTMAGRTTRTQNQPDPPPSPRRETSKDDKDQVKCPTFTGTNFPIWKKKMWIFLKYKKLHRCIEEPLPDEPTEAEEADYLAAAATLGSHISDDVYNHVINDDNIQDAYQIWEELQSSYAASTVLAIFRTWSKWEDVKYEGSMLQYIKDMEAVLAEFAAMGLDIPSKLISCGIIARVTKKRPALMETLLSSNTLLEQPKRLIAKLRDIGNHDEVTATPVLVQTSATTALVTHAHTHGSRARGQFRGRYTRGRGRPPKRARVTCDGDHNPEAGHPEEECWTLHPEKYEEAMRQRGRPPTTGLLTTTTAASQSQVQVQPSYGFCTSVDSLAAGEKIVLDSGASHHMLNDPRMFLDRTPTNIEVLTGNRGDGKALVATARGTACLNFDNGEVLELKDALYVPSLARNLVSLVQLLRCQATIVGNDGRYQVQIDSQSPFTVDASNFILEIDGVRQPGAVSQANTALAKDSSDQELSDYERWHIRLGHASRARIQAMLKDGVKLGKSVTCQACMAGKLTRLPYNSHFKPATEPLQVVHGDLVGPITPATNGGARYFLTLVDQFSGHISTKILKLKSDALEAIKVYIAYVERQTGRKLKKLVTDGGGEFVNKALTEILTQAGIQHNISPPYTPQHNGFAERANRTIIEMTRTLMMQANLAPEWWGEAVTAATATTNCLSSLSKSKASPIELMFKSTPNLAIFRPFGCRAWIIKPSQNRATKFGSLSWEGIHLGYENDLSTYKLLRLEDKACAV